MGVGDNGTLNGHVYCLDGVSSGELAHLPCAAAQPVRRKTATRVIRHCGSVNASGGMIASTPRCIAASSEESGTIATSLESRGRTEMQDTVESTDG